MFHSEPAPINPCDIRCAYVARKKLETALTSCQFEAKNLNKITSNQKVRTVIN